MVPFVDRSCVLNPIPHFQNSNSLSNLVNSTVDAGTEMKSNGKFVRLRATFSCTLFSVINASARYLCQIGRHHYTIPFYHLKSINLTCGKGSAWRGFNASPLSVANDSSQIIIGTRELPYGDGGRVDLMRIL